MIKLELKGTKFVLIRRSRNLLGEPASDWAGMRWVTLHVSESSAFQQGIIDSYQTKYPWLCFQEEVSDADIREKLGVRGLCIAHAEFAWSIALGLAKPQLCSEELSKYCDPRQCALNLEILDAVQSVYSSVALELTKNSSFRFLDSKQQSIFLQKEINCQAQQTYVTPSDDLVRFFFLVLDHIHWFAVQRFQIQGQNFSDGPCSIYLNSDEFQADVIRLKYWSSI